MSAAEEAADLFSGLSYRLEDQDLIRLSALGLMSTGIAHDMGNLLQVVASAVRLIDRNLDRESSAAIAPLLNSALVSVDRAAALSRQVMDAARSPAALNEIVVLPTTMRALAPLIELMAGPSVRVTFEVGGDAPSVICNARELENVILNLVINARDAMPEGGALHLSVERERAANGRFAATATALVGDAVALIKVRDTGCGMTREVLERVFRPFFTTKPPGYGSGLGLAMVSDFARRVGGSAEIESELSVGTTVTLRVPACGGPAWREAPAEDG